jgi:hypothetical protein
MMTMPSTQNPQEVLEHGFFTVTLDKEGVA